MKTFILTDNYLDEPLKVIAKSKEEALNKVADYYRHQLDFIYTAETLYNMRLIEVEDLEELM